jgi:hypothetical protein
MTAPMETDEMTAAAEADEMTAAAEADEMAAPAEADEMAAGAEADEMAAGAEADEMTAPAETAGDHLMVQEDDRVIAQESAFDLAGATSGETAEDHQMVPEDDRDMPHGLDLDPAGAITAGDPQSPVAAAPEHPGATDADSALAEPGVAGASDAGSPSAVVPAPDAEPEPARAAPVAGDSASADARWHEILAMFVDDPRSSVGLAAGLVGDSAEALVMFVQERLNALLSTWQGDDAGTEEMRIALQQYRTFWNRIEDLSREA